MKSHFSVGHRPAWYELGIGDVGNITLAIHRKALKDLGAVNWSASPQIRGLERAFNLHLFTPPGEHDCGFGDVCKIIPSFRPEWVKFNIRLPKAAEDSSRYALLVRSSINVVTLALSTSGIGDTGWHEPQLVVVEAVCLPFHEQSIGNGALAITLTPTVTDWLSKQPLGRHNRLREALYEAYAYMSPRTVHQDDQFDVTIRSPKWLRMALPGHCRMFPSSPDSSSSGEGYMMTTEGSHYSNQQLAYLYTLARLHELVRTNNTAG